MSFRLLSTLTTKLLVVYPQNRGLVTGTEPGPLPGCVKRKFLILLQFFGEEVKN